MKRYVKIVCNRDNCHYCYFNYCYRHSFVCQTIDSYIDTAKQWGIQSLGLLLKKVTEVANKSLVYLLQTVGHWDKSFCERLALNQLFDSLQAQTLLFTHIHSPSLTEQQLQSQRLLTQSNPSNRMPFLQQLIFSGSPPRTNQSQPSTGLTPPGFPDDVDGSPMHIAPQNLSQRWFSTETINIVDISETTATSYPIGLRARSESESNLLDVQYEEVEGKPPIQPKQARKRTKAKATSDKPSRKPRAASAKARAKLKETLTETVPSSSED